MWIYLNGHFIKSQEASISPDDRGFLFGDGTYEVIRIYHGEWFRMEAHLSRFKRSLDALRISFEPFPDFQVIGRELQSRNGLSGLDASFYLQVTRGAAPRRHRFPDAGTPPTVYAKLSPIHPEKEKWEKGGGIILLPDTRWSRCDIKSISLLANVLACQEAVEQGADEAVFVRGGTVREGTHTNFCAVFSGEVWTHPVDHSILDGITRMTVLECCTELGIPVREKPIPESGLQDAEEVFIIGSITEIMPVISIGGRAVADGKPGSVTSAVQAAYRKRVDAL
ncbi:D-amino acid aminotransferase [bacterium]|nr:D-amino acid aminotransferase [bacterium]